MSTQLSIGILAFTQQGRALAEVIKADSPHQFITYEKTPEGPKGFVKQQFAACDALVFVGAVGIAVRLLADLLVAKEQDPAVVVIDEKGGFVIPILSGHLGGANALAMELAKQLQATPVITTATDLNGLFAVDCWSKNQGCVIADSSKIKWVSAAVLEKQPVGFATDQPWGLGSVQQLPQELVWAEQGAVGICLSLNPNCKPFHQTCNVLPKILTLGIGCRKGTSYQSLRAFISQVLAENRLDFRSVAALASIDLKKAEPCLLELAQKQGVPFVTYAKEELAALPGTFTASGFVASVTGVDNVCERSALLRSGGKLLLKKTIGLGMTLAIAKSDWGFSF